MSAFVAVVVIAAEVLEAGVDFSMNLTMYRDRCSENEEQKEAAVK